MRYLLFNANGLSGKADFVYEFFITNQIDICFIIETWNHSYNSSYIFRPFINITREKVFRPGRGRMGGGILGMCHPKYLSSIQIIEEDPQANYAILKVGEHYIGVGYFPPSSNDQLLISFIDKMAEITDN